MANYIVTKIVSTAGLFRTFQQLYPPMFDVSSANPIKKITFTVEAGGVLTAKSMPQNISCFANEGDAVKLINNSGGNLPIDITLYGNEQYGDGLDLRTAISFATSGTGAVNAIIYI